MTVDGAAPPLARNRANPAAAAPPTAPGDGTLVAIANGATGAPGPLRAGPAGSAQIPRPVQLAGMGTVAGESTTSPRTFAQVWRKSERRQVPPTAGSSRVRRRRCPSFWRAGRTPGDEPELLAPGGRDDAGRARGRERAGHLVMSPGAERDDGTVRRRAGGDRGAARRRGTPALEVDRPGRRAPVEAQPSRGAVAASTAPAPRRSPPRPRHAGDPAATIPGAPRRTSATAPGWAHAILSAGRARADRDRWAPMPNGP